MPRAVLNPARRYAVRGNTTVLVMPRETLTDGVLTLAALDDAATTDITGEIVPPIAGFSLEQGDLPTPDLSTMQTGNVPGEITTTASSMTFYLSKDADDIRSVLVTGAEVYVIVADNGLDAGALVDIYPCTVKYGAKQREDVSRIMIPFAVEVDVQENVPVPAA